MDNSKFKTVEEYILSFSKDIQERLNQLRKIIKEEATKAEEKISYNMPSYMLKGRLLYFAVHTNHIGLYALPSANIKFKDELRDYETSKGTIKFPHNKPLLTDLIRKIVKFRVKENLEKSKET